MTHADVMMTLFICHSERSEESQPLGNKRSFALLRMTYTDVMMTHYLIGVGCNSLYILCFSIARREALIKKTLKSYSIKILNIYYCYLEDTSC